MRPRYVDAMPVQPSMRPGRRLRAWGGKATPTLDLDGDPDPARILGSPSAIPFASLETTRSGILTDRIAYVLRV